jgi:cohesin loading factor subunit SCC2
MHAILHGKHSTMLNIRFLDFARDSFDYQKTITGEVSGARHGVALLAPWWSLLSEKRAVRIDFLKHVVRAFDFELAGQDEVSSWVTRAS